MASELETPKPARSPWQRLYAAALARRRAGARRTARSLPCPAISVGNLHWGGAGKTPAVAAIAQHLAASGRAVAILSRGYGRSETGARLVSTGEGPLCDWRQSGDEPYWLARRSSGVVVAVGADRLAAAQLALAARPIDLFLLDDAFSHVKVARELELLVFPASDPFGGARLLPSGRLREPLAAAACADAVLLTGVAAGTRHDYPRAEELASRLRAFGFAGPGFDVAEKARIAGRETSGPAVDGPVLLVTGTARPERVAATAARLGIEVVRHLRFPDHHDYPERSLRRIRAAAGGGVPVLTTSKDEMKLAGRLGTALFVLELEAEPEPAFWDWLDARVESVLLERAAERR